MNRKERVQAFVETIWEWYSVHKRTLPWRDLPDANPTERGYKVLVSEIMLQQTQVPRVIVTYRNFLEQFPSLRDLAQASNKEVLMAWRGMGYNSRALRLRDGARVIIGGQKGRKAEGKKKTFTPSSLHTSCPFPMSMEDLTSIPGIGHYTAAAIRNFAFGIPTPCIDTNIRRILHRTFVGAENSDGTWGKDDEYLLEVAREVLEEALVQSKRGNRSKQGKQGSSFSSFPSFTSFASDWHAALMDFGSLVQTKRNPKWDICPLTKKGIMKAKRVKTVERAKRVERKEPGRTVGSTFIPNRIFRGRVIEALRDAPKGLTPHDIGKHIALDWDPKEHREWLDTILKQLTREAMLRARQGKYVLG